MAPLSVLDLSPIIQGSHAGQALCNSLDLARRTEKLGYNRYWVAEHHNMAGIASAATAVVIGHIASGTQIIRVGSGGIMLPNHAPLVIAEQFGRSNLSTLVESTSDWVGHPVPISSQPMHFDAISLAMWTSFHAMYRNCRATSDPTSRANASQQFRETGWRFPSGFWARVSMAPSWLQHWVCRTLSLLTLHQLQ